MHSRRFRPRKFSARTFGKCKKDGYPPVFWFQFGKGVKKWQFWPKITFFQKISNFVKKIKFLSKKWKKLKKMKKLSKFVKKIKILSKNHFIPPPRTPRHPLRPRGLWNGRVWGSLFVSRFASWTYDLELYSIASFAASITWTFLLNHDSEMIILTINLQTLDDSLTNWMLIWVAEIVCSA